MKVILPSFRCQVVSMKLAKGQNPLRHFPRSNSATSPQHKRQVRNKLARAKVRCVCCVVSFLKFHYNNLLPTCCGLVCAPCPQQVGNFPDYGETCVMDCGHKSYFSEVPMSTGFYGTRSTIATTTIHVTFIQMSAPHTINSDHCAG